jgi:hypothetical protein
LGEERRLIGFFYTLRERDRENVSEKKIYQLPVFIDQGIEYPSAEETRGFRSKNAGDKLESFSLL